MANKCGDCQFFTGSGRCDQGNKSVTSSSGVVKIIELLYHLPMPQILAVVTRQFQDKY